MKLTMTDRMTQRFVSSCILATAIAARLPTNAWAVDTTINGSALALRSYSQAFNSSHVLQTTFGMDSGTSAVFKTDGYAGTYIYLPSDGAVTFTANASGTASSGVDPDMSISIADFNQSFTVNAAHGSSYTYTTPVLPAGTYFVRTQLDNQGATTPQLTLNSLTVSSNATVLNASDTTSENNNALAAADTYIANFRQGAATVSTGFSSGTPVQVSMVRNAFNFGSYVPGFNQQGVADYLGANPTAPAFQSFLNKNFNMLVPSDAGKWGWDEAQQNSMTMQAADMVTAYAKAHNMTGRMHNLLWSFGSEDPSFVTDQLNASTTNNPTTALMSAITNRIGYYIAGGNAGINAPAVPGLNPPYPQNQLNTVTNDVRATDFAEVDILNEPLHQTPFYRVLGPANTAYIYYQAKQAAAAAGANTLLYTNEYNVLQNSSLSVSATTGRGTGSDPYANWYQQFIVTLNNQSYNIPNVGTTALGKVVSGVGVEWYPAGSATAANAATMQQALQNLSVLGLPVSIGESSIQSSISTTDGTATSDASNVQVLDTTLRLMYGTPSVNTYALWGWYAGDTNSMGSSSVLVNTDGSLTAAGVRYEYLFGLGTDTSPGAIADGADPLTGVNPTPWNTPAQIVSVNPNSTIHFNGVYGEYALSINGITYATVDFEKGPNNTPLETLWVKGDFNLDGKLTNADFQAMLLALQSQNRIVDGALVDGWQAAHNMSNEEFMAICDINGDGVFDAADISGMLQLLSSGIQAGNGIFGGGGSLSNVPESPTFVMAGLASLITGVAFGRSRRKHPVPR
jgi:hypothetical protein